MRRHGGARRILSLELLGFKNLLSPASLYSRVNRWQILKPKMSSNDRKGFCALQRCRLELSLVWKLLPFYLPYLIRSNFIKTTYDISLDSQISFLPLGFSPTEVVSCLSSVGNLNPKVRRQRNLEHIFLSIQSWDQRRLTDGFLVLGHPLVFGCVSTLDRKICEEKEENAHRRLM